MVLPYHYKSFSLRLFLSVALLNILGILVINSATYHDMAVVGRQMTGAAIGAVFMLVICVILNLSLLGFFKYASLFVSTVKLLSAGDG